MCDIPREARMKAFWGTLLRLRWGRREIRPLYGRWTTAAANDQTPERRIRSRLSIHARQLCPLPLSLHKCESSQDCQQKSSGKVGRAPTSLSLLTHLSNSQAAGPARG